MKPFMLFSSSEPLETENKKKTKYLNQISNLIFYLIIYWFYFFIWNYLLIRVIQTATVWTISWIVRLRSCFYIFPTARTWACVRWIKIVVRSWSYSKPLHFVWMKNDNWFSLLIINLNVFQCKIRWMIRCWYSF